MANSVNGFVMHGARTAMEEGLQHIEEHIKTIEQSVTDNTGLAFDLAKNLIETTCQRILKDRNISFDPQDDVPQLLNAVMNSVPLLPPSASSSVEVRRSLARTLGGLRAAVQGVCELRNECGFASHGSDAPRPKMETVQAILAAEAADAIIGFLYSVHQQDHAGRAKRKLRYGDNAEFNDYVDGLHEPVRILNEEFSPSKVLFELAPEPYRFYLAEYPPESETEDEAEPEAEVPVPVADGQSIPVAVLTDAAATDVATVEQAGASEVAND
jgi:hypothetical protein